MRKRVTTCAMARSGRANSHKKSGNIVARCESRAPMTIIPSALSAATVLITLDWITPPSLLSPLPPHLLSSALRQRHHFLRISPDNPSEYLTWPSGGTTQHTVIERLEALPKPTEHLSCNVRYSADDESAFAHVEISSDISPGLRLIFQWDPDGWKYHNIALMPFPPNTFESLLEAMSIKSVPQSPTIVLDDDDSYWNAYSRDGDHEGPIKSAAPEPLSEDAYWARYTSVQGQHNPFTLTYDTFNVLF